MSNIQERKELIVLQIQEFELEQRRAKALSVSAFFPQDLKNDVASAVIIYDLANRMNVSVMEVAQSVYIIHGRPSFSTTFLVARLNQSRLIKGALKTILAPDKQSAYCTAIDSVTGEEMIGMAVTMKMANAEGWVSKRGSKWQTMPELMMRKRCQSFFIKEFYPQIMFGMQTQEELIDVEALPVTKAKIAKQDMTASLSTSTQDTPWDAKYDHPAPTPKQTETRDEIETDVIDVLTEPEPPKKKRRSKEEVAELLVEANNFRAEDTAPYTNLKQIPAQEGREAVQRIEERKATPDPSSAITRAHQAARKKSDELPDWSQDTTSAELPDVIKAKFDEAAEQGMEPQHFKHFVSANIQGWASMSASEINGYVGEIFSDKDILRGKIVEYYQRKGLNVPHCVEPI